MNFDYNWPHWLLRRCFKIHCPQQFSHEIWFQMATQILRETRFNLEILSNLKPRSNNNIDTHVASCTHLVECV